MASTLSPTVSMSACAALLALAPLGLAGTRGERLPYDLRAGSFESDAIDPCWRPLGAIRPIAGGQYGKRALAAGPGAWQLSQRLVLTTSAACFAAGDVPQAALWYDVVRCAAPGVLEVRLAAELATGEEVLAHERVVLRPEHDRPWCWLATYLDGALAVPPGARALVLEIRGWGDLELEIDFVELGPGGTLHGAPRRLALASYAGWYRSPLAAEATGSGTGTRELWQNWAWLTPPHCDAGDESLLHDPNCATSSQCFRANGRRDGAVSTLSDLDELPLSGLYDSRDPDLVRYHVDLGHAIGLDAFVVDWYGKLLAEQNVLPGEEPVGLAALEELFRAAKDQDEGFKIGVMYEPKVHMSGWVWGEPTFAEKKAGIVTDLVWLVQRYAARTTFLRRDGRPVLFVFDQEACTSSGACLDDDDWADIQSSVLAATGEELFLIGTVRPEASDTRFQGFLRWGLVAPPLVQYATYADFAARNESWPPPTVVDLLAHARLLASITREWTDQAADRLAVGIVWPGFDDSGVAGWGVQNGAGSDGHPLCVRVCGDLGGAYLPITFRALLEDGLEWAHLCTFNDWNEGTAIEPRWNALYFADVSAGRRSTPTTLKQVFARAFATQAGIEAYKAATGIDLDARAIEAVARAYVEDQIAGRATLYD